GCLSDGSDHSHASGVRSRQNRAGSGHRWRRRQCRHPTGPRPGRGKGDFDDDQPGEGEASADPWFRGRRRSVLRESLRWRGSHHGRPRRGCRHRERRRCADGSSTRHACAPWRSHLAGIFRGAQDDDRCHGLDLEARQHERLLPVRAIADGQSGCMGYHLAAAVLGQGEDDPRASVQARRGGRSPAASDRRPALRPSGVGEVGHEGNSDRNIRQSGRGRPDLAKRVAAETGNAPITLALDGVSDTSPMNLMSCLSESGVLVSYGGTSRKPMVVNPGSFIFKKQTIHGFWLLYWSQSATPAEITAMFEHLAPLIAASTISTPVAATYRFRPSQGRDHARGPERWQGPVRAEDVRRPRVDFTYSATEAST